MSVRFEDEMKVAGMMAVSIWTDKPLQRFLDRYYPLLCEALMDFVIEGSYARFDDLAFYIEDSAGRGEPIRPKRLADLHAHFLYISRMIKIWS